MVEFCKFSSGGKSGVMPKRDCLFNPHEERRSSFLKKKDVSAARYHFSADQLAMGTAPVILSGNNLMEESLHTV